MRDTKTHMNTFKNETFVDEFTVLAEGGTSTLASSVRQTFAQLTRLVVAAAGVECGQEGVGRHGRAEYLPHDAHEPPRVLGLQ